ncbi:hypothetical protein QFZ49_004422 [Streptomyces turgidiscabies]|uniref:Uncharacterized protein n=1 Tax=Streptomyces turgidiscabies TaxID=85558 RepID=A0ABU0RR69_9ACTN|nr:hypothetical protein [Streptomyces turgidiscabies]
MVTCLTSVPSALAVNSCVHSPTTRVKTSLLPSAENTGAVPDAMIFFSALVTGLYVQMPRLS